MICAIGIGLSHFWKMGPLTLQTAGVALVVPAITSVLFICLSFSVPDLYAVNSLRFPITLTLPLIYIVSLLLTMMLLSRVGLSITRMPDGLSAIDIWASPGTLGLTLIGGFACLSVLGLLERERKER